MDLNVKPPMSPEQEPELEPVFCSICFDPVLEASPGTRSVATLQCSHTFHLDCIGSAFNTKGIMQCPNCRHTENGDWLMNTNELQPSTDSDSHFGSGVARETYEVISGPVQGSNIINQIIIRSTTVEAHQVLSELLRQPTVDGSVLLNSVLRNLAELQSISTGMEGDPSHIQVFYGPEPRNSETQHYLGTTPMVDFVNRLALRYQDMMVAATAPFGFEVPRYDGSSQRHYSTQPTPGSGSSSVTPSGPSPAFTSRDHARHRVMRGHVQQTDPMATRSRPYPPIYRRNGRPSAVSIASSIAASYRAEDSREPHDVYRARAAYVQNIMHNQENAYADQPYTNLLGQWRPSAEPGTASYSQHNQENSSFPSGSTSELPPEFLSENGYLSEPSNWRHPFL